MAQRNWNIELVPNILWVFLLWPNSRVFLVSASVLTHVQVGVSAISFLESYKMVLSPNPYAKSSWEIFVDTDLGIGCHLYTSAAWLSLSKLLPWATCPGSHLDQTSLFRLVCYHASPQTCSVHFYVSYTVSEHCFLNRPHTSGIMKPAATDFAPTL